MPPLTEVSLPKFKTIMIFKKCSIFTLMVLQEMMGEEENHCWLEFRHTNRHKKSLISWQHNQNWYKYRTDLTPVIQDWGPQRVIMGDTITIFFENFNEEPYSCTRTTVLIDGVESETSCDRNTGMVSATVPARQAGQYDIRINDPVYGDAFIAGSLGNQVHMRLDIDSIKPQSGSFGGGTEITITGAGLSAETLNGRICGKPLENCQFADDGQQVKVTR